jgi:acyl-coenzyme A synthetase/AMP-(fatty) acid ligase
LVDRAQKAKFAALLATQPEDFPPVMLRGDDPFVTIFTSGTTGHPKAVRYPLAALLGVAAYMRDAIDLRVADRFWCVADPGWAYGMLFTVIGPLLLGRATTMFEGPFTVESTVKVIDSQAITNLAAAPTAYRLMMAAGDDAVAPISGQLRVASSAGEPLNPDWNLNYCCPHPNKVEFDLNSLMHVGKHGRHQQVDLRHCFFGVAVPSRGRRRSRPARSFPRCRPGAQPRPLRRH